DQQQANLANYLSNTGAFSTYLGLPVTESDTVNLQFGISKTQILTGYKVQQFDTTTTPPTPVLDADGNPVYYYSYYSPEPIVAYITRLDHSPFHTWSLTPSWAHDTRNRFFNPTHGSLQQFSAEVALPGSTVEYYKLIYRYAQYIPITSALTFEGSATIGY